MKLASRITTLEPEGAYQILAKAQELEKQGRSIVHFEIGQPDFSTPKSITEAGIKALRQGYTRYTPPLGIPELRHKIAQHVTSSKKIPIHESQVAVTPSAKTAIFIACAALLEAGDEVLYPDPGFPTYKTLINFFGAKPIPIPLDEQTGFDFNVDAFKKRLSRKTKLLIINSPSNPTGGVISPRTLMSIAMLIAKTDCWVLSDEIYSEIVYNKRSSSIYELPGMKDRTILVDGFSKTYAMTGWRLGYLIFPETLVNYIDYLLSHSVGCTASFTQKAGLSALTTPSANIRKMVAAYRARRDYIVTGLNKIPGISCVTPQGAFYAFPNIRGTGMTSSDFAKVMLSQAGVALLPGTSFGEAGEGYVRLSYATSITKISAGLGRMKKTLSDKAAGNKRALVV